MPDHEELRALCDAATPGEWLYRPLEFDDWGIVRAGRSIICQARDPRASSEEALSEYRHAGTDPWEANARFIAAARTAIPALLDRVAVLEELVAGLSGQFDHQGCTCTFPSDDCCAFAKAAVLQGATDA